MFLSFCLLLLCITASVTNDNHRLYEKRNLTDVVLPICVCYHEIYEKDKGLAFATINIAILLYISFRHCSK